MSHIVLSFAHYRNVSDNIQAGLHERFLHNLTAANTAFYDVWRVNTHAIVINWSRVLELCWRKQILVSISIKSVHVFIFSGNSIQLWRQSIYFIFLVTSTTYVRVLHSKIDAKVA